MNIETISTTHILDGLRFKCDIFVEVSTFPCWRTNKVLKLLNWTSHIKLSYCLEADSRISFQENTGVYIFQFAFWRAKIRVIGWLGGKYEDFLRKNANIRGKRWKKGENRKFSVYILGGEKISFRKKGGGQKY